MVSVTEREDQADMFKPIKPHFFKVILGDATHTDKLGIPARFVRKYGKDLEDSVLLKIPNGCSWRVDLTKTTDGEIWFSRGWQEFAKEFALERGHFLVFKYDTNSSFHVVIYDTSATEIDYPSNNGEKPPNLDGVIEEGSNDETIEVLHNSSGVKNDQSQLLSDSSHERKSSSLARRGRKHGQKASQVLKRAISGFKSENPHFPIILRLAYIVCENIFIPYKFVVAYLKGNHDEVVLQDKVGRSWNVRLNATRRRVSFTSGWSTFVSDNNLKVDDVLIFELIKIDKRPVFNFHIARSSGDADCSEPEDSGNGAGVVKDCGSSSKRVKRVDESSKIKQLKENPSSKTQCSERVTWGLYEKKQANTKN